MYIMYVDESGDIGLNNSPTDHYVLSGIVLHELRWAECLNQIVEFRRRLRNIQTISLKLREEIHAAEMFSSPKELARIPKFRRLQIVRMFADELASIPYLNVINVVVDKRGKNPNYDVFEAAWAAIIQRLENTTSAQNFRGPKNPDERYLIVPDQTDVTKLRNMTRRMRYYNPIPNQQRFGVGYRNLPLRLLVEDPVFRDSKDSYFIQAADLVAFLLYQYNRPNAYMRKKHAHNYFERLDPILCKVCNQNHPLGILYL